MQRATGDSIDIRQIPAGYGSQSHEIEVGILCDERIERPLNPVNSPLQGETARDWLQIAPDESLNSVVLLDSQGIHRKTDAVWRMLAQLGGAWRIAGWLLRMIPRPVRNLGYDLVARHRYRWFGKKETCRLPTFGERARFLP